MKRKVLFILIGALLCFIAGPMSTDAADTYCPPIHVPPGGVCNCTVFNYGTVADTGVVIEMYDGTGDPRVVANDVQPGGYLYSSWPLPVHSDHWTAVACKVHGIGVRSRVSLECYATTSPPGIVGSYAIAVCGD